MKTYFKIAIPVLLGITMVYTSCQKSANKPASADPTTTVNTASEDVVSAQVASTLSQSLSGSLGGINVNKSLNPSSLTSSYPSSTYSLCGFVADSVLNYYSNSDTIKSHTTGNTKFIFDCIKGQPDGFTAYDTTLTVGTSPTTAFIYKIYQYYRIYVCGCGILTVNGDQIANVDTRYYNNAAKASFAHNSYILNNLTIDLHKDADITSGTATFTSVGVNAFGKWNLSGTITYLGNHTARVAVGTNSYLVNIATGSVIN